MWQRVTRLESPWPTVPPGNGDAVASTTTTTVHVATGPLAVADLIALLVAARHAGGRKPHVIREWAGCRPAVSFDHADGMPRPVASSARWDEWLDAACKAAGSCSDNTNVIVHNRRLHPLPPVTGGAADPLPAGPRIVTPPTVTIILPKTQRSLGKLDADATILLDQLSRTLRAGGPPPLPPPGVALDALADERAAALADDTGRHTSQFLAAAQAVLARWEAVHADSAMRAPTRHKDALAGHVEIVAKRVDTAAANLGDTLRLHARRIA
ncbi:MAG: hypothetical protein AB7S36_11030, partial [Planctomycetota bacterium]